MSPIWRSLLVATAFLLGAWGLRDAYAGLGQHPAIAHIGWLAARLVVGNFPDDLDGRDVPPALEIARWALPLLTVWSTLAVTWGQVRNPLRLALMRMRGEHLVVAGDDGLAGRVARAELRRGHRVLLWTTDRRLRWIDDAIEQGGASVEAVGATLAVEKLALEKAGRVLLVAPDDLGNVALAGRVVAQAAQRRLAGDTLDVIVRVDNLDLRGGIETHFERSVRSAARVRFVSVPDIAARALFTGQPLDQFRRSGAQARCVFLFGYSPMAVSYLLRLLAGGHFRDSIKPRLIVVDPAAEACQVAFQAAHPGADRLSPICFEHAVIDQAALGARKVVELAARYGEPVKIVVDCSDDARSLALGLAIEAAFAERGVTAPPIHPYLQAPVADHLGLAIRPFGNLDDLSDPDLLLQVRHDALAQSIHDFYLEGRLDQGARIGESGSMREWDDLPERFRDDNRLVADCYHLKLRDIGARLVPGTGPSLRLSDVELEDLSRAEHDRWMASKVATGWVYGASRDDERRLHPNIVAYEALSEAIRDLDREQIRIMARLVARGGQRALRTLSIGILPGQGTAIAAGMERVLEHLVEHYPDRALLMTGSFEDAATRAALQVATSRGVATNLLIAGNAQAIAGTLPLDARLGAGALTRSADTIVALGSGEAITPTLCAEADLVLAADQVDAIALPVIRLAVDGTILQAPWYPRC